MATYAEKFEITVSEEIERLKEMYTASILIFAISADIFLEKVENLYLSIGLFLAFQIISLIGIMQVTSVIIYTKRRKIRKKVHKYVEKLVDTRAISSIISYTSPGRVHFDLREAKNKIGINESSFSILDDMELLIFLEEKKVNLFILSSLSVVSSGQETYNLPESTGWFNAVYGRGHLLYVEKVLVNVRNSEHDSDDYGIEFEGEHWSINPGERTLCLSSRKDMAFFLAVSSGKTLDIYPEISSNIYFSDKSLVVAESGSDSV